jgi:hypothetical protein
MMKEMPAMARFPPSGGRLGFIPDNREGFYSTRGSCAARHPGMDGPCQHVHTTRYTALAANRFKGLLERLRTHQRPALAGCGSSRPRAGL